MRVYVYVCVRYIYIYIYLARGLDVPRRAVPRAPRGVLLQGRLAHDLVVLELRHGDLHLRGRRYVSVMLQSVAVCWFGACYHTVVCCKSLLISQNASSERVRYVLAPRSVLRLSLTRQLRWQRLVRWGRQAAELRAHRHLPQR